MELDVRRELMQLKHDVAANEVKRLKTSQNSWRAIIKIQNRVSTISNIGLLHSNKIECLENKMVGVETNLEEMKDQIANLSKSCDILQQRAMGDFQEIAEDEIMERTRPPVQRPNSAIASVDTNREMGNTSDYKYNRSVKKWGSVSKKNKKSNLVNRKAKSNKTLFLCKICDKEYVSKSNLQKHSKKMHPSSSKNNPSKTVVKGPRKCYQCCEAPYKDYGKLQKSKRSSLCGQKSLQREFVNGELICAFCTYWTFHSTALKIHVEKVHQVR